MFKYVYPVFLHPYTSQSDDNTVFIIVSAVHATAGIARKMTVSLIFSSDK